MGSKGKVGDQRAGPKIVQLWRNRIRGMERFCPIVALFDFYLVSGMFEQIDHMQQLPREQQHYLPMLPQYVESSRSFNFLVPATTSWMQSKITAVLRKCTWHAEDNIDPDKGVTPHALRSSAAVWALRCGGFEHDVQLCGGWSEDSNRSFNMYIRQAKVLQTHFENKHQPDPIFSLWCWQNSFVAINQGYKRRPPPPGAQYTTSAAAGSS